MRFRCFVLGPLLFCLAGCIQTQMPGTSFAGSPPPATANENALAARLRDHVHHLSVDIGRRHVGEHPNLLRAAAYLDAELTSMALQPRSQSWDVDGKTVRNIEVTFPGTQHPNQIILIGAHYDSARRSPAADDNGSGVAVALELARSLKNASLLKTIRIVFFVNEEPPFFGTNAMGSWHYAQAARARRDDIRAMIALDSIGRYSSEPGSQHYPALVASQFPKTGNFLAFVTRNEDVELLRQSITTFRRTTPVPSEGAAMPAFMEGVWYSDHWSFWQFGYPALMLTDTAFFRYPEYHTSGDTIDHIDFLTLARVTKGLQEVIEELSAESDHRK